MSMQDVTFHDDSFDFNPDQLKNQQHGADGPLPLPGYYKVRLISAGVKTNKETKEMITDSKGNPVFAIQRIGILEGAETQGLTSDSFGVFKDIYTNGFQPRDFKTGKDLPGPKRYEFIEALASIDATEVTADFNDNVQALGKLLASHPVITVRLGYTGTDVTYAKAQIANGTDKRAAYKAAELKPAAFRNNDGTWRTEAQGPSGEMVKAKLRITEFVDSRASKELGPLKLRGSN